TDLHLSTHGPVGSTRRNGLDAAPSSDREYASCGVRRRTHDGRGQQPGQPADAISVVSLSSAFVPPSLVNLLLRPRQLFLRMRQSGASGGSLEDRTRPLPIFTATKDAVLCQHWWGLAHVATNATSHDNGG